ncbi:MAG: transposase [bacterium]|nr:transposase [bacterium]
MNAGEKRAKKRTAGLRRAAKQGKRKELGRERRYMAWKHLTRNQKEVARRLAHGKGCDYVHDGSWGFFDRFLVFLKGIGYLTTLNLDGEGYARRMITIAKLLLTYQARVLLGIDSVNKIPHMLFGDIGLLMTLGWTAMQIKEGVCKRGKGKHDGPIHKDTLPDCLQRLSAEEITQCLNDGIQLLRKIGIRFSGIFALDATDLTTTEKCKGRGVKRIEHKKRDKDGNPVVIPEMVYGFKLVYVFDVLRRYVVAAKMLQIQESENPYLLEMVDQARKNIGRDVIRLLLVDRGFLDGGRLWELKHKRGIDFVIPSKTDMAVSQDIRGMRRLPEDEHLRRQEWDTEEGTVRAVGVAGLTTFDEYRDPRRKRTSPQPINAVMVTCWEGHEYTPGEEKVFLTSLGVHTPREVIDRYDLRSLIENCGNRDLKQGWLINKYPKKQVDAIRAHVYLTIGMFNMTLAYRSHEGEEIAQECIRRYRLKTMAQARHKCMIVCGDHYAIFDLEELMMLLGQPVRCPMRTDEEQFRKLHGL